MKIQKCYSLDSRIVSALTLVKTSVPNSSHSLLIEKYVADGIARDLERVPSDNVRTEIVEQLESYKDAGA